VSLLNQTKLKKRWPVSTDFIRLGGRAALMMLQLWLNFYFRMMLAGSLVPSGMQMVES